MPKMNNNRVRYQKHHNIKHLLCFLTLFIATCTESLKKFKQAMSEGTRPWEPDSNLNNGSRGKHIIPATFTMPAKDIYTDFAKTNNHHLGHTSLFCSKRNTSPQNFMRFCLTWPTQTLSPGLLMTKAFESLTRSTSWIRHKFFKFKNINSFYRMLNLLGFKCLHQPGPDNLAYYGQKFLQGLPQSAAQIKNQLVKSRKTSLNNRGESKNKLNHGWLLCIPTVLTILSYSQMNQTSTNG
jgi:hypothetical protein